MSKLLAPNGKPSNLTPEQYKLVRSKEFISWFGDWENDPENASKVVDENGEPLVVYHSTGYDFNIFKLSEIGKSIDYGTVGSGFYFTSSYENAENYKKSLSSNDSNVKNEKIIKCFLNIRKIKDESNHTKFSGLNKKESEKYTEKLKLNGFNGIVVDIYFSRRDNYNWYVAFEPNQIKLADGTNTTFDGGNPDIRFDEGGSLEEIYYIPTDKSKEIITDFTHYKSGENYYPITQWANWFISQDRKSKEYIANSISNSNKLRNAFISNWYDDYKIKNNNLTFEEFLNKDIEVYRGQTSRDLKYGQSFGFDSYTTDKSLAEHFARDGNGLVIKKNVKPKETYGLIQSIGNEKEVMIPTKFSDEFLQKEWYDLSNKNMKIFDNLSDKDMTEFEELENSKNYQGLIDKLKDMLNIKSDNNFEKGGEVNTGLFSQIWEWFGIKF